MQNQPRNLIQLSLIAAVSGVLCFVSLLDKTAANQAPQRFWIEAGQSGTLPAEMHFSNSQGQVGVLNTAGPVQMKDHPFFEPLGLNPRGCVTCHQPVDAMSVSVESLRERWRITKGDDPIFAPIDGSNNPRLPQAPESSHSLLLNRGLFRVGLQWPPKDHKGNVIKPEFTIDVVRDPTGVNLDSTYGLTGVNPTVSVFRRPRPVANLKYVMASDEASGVPSGTSAAIDPETGKPFSLNLMSDARHLTLKQQAFGAYRDHQEGRQGQLPSEEMAKILAFENQIYVAQSVDRWGGSLIEPSRSTNLGPRALAEAKVRAMPGEPVFSVLEAWKNPAALPKEMTEAQRAFRVSVARGNAIFLSRQFRIQNVAHSNSIGWDNANKQTCTSCHRAPMTGQALSAGWIDLGTTNYPTWTEPSVFSNKAELPIFKCTCDKNSPPHPYLGRVVFTNDPGRALITGKCADIGSIVIGQFRGLASRAPYFTNGSAKTLRDLVDFHDRRFDIKLTEQEKTDLVNFLSVL